MYVPHEALLADGSQASFDGRGVQLADVQTDTETTATNCAKSFEPFTLSQIKALPGRPPLPVGGPRLKVVQDGGGTDGHVYVPVTPSVPGWQFDDVEVCFWAESASLVGTADHHPNMLTVNLLADATGAENSGASADFAMRGRRGWNVVRFHRDHFDSVFGGFDWGTSTIKRLKLIVKAPNASSGTITLHFAYIALRRKSKAVFVHVFDDLVETQHSHAYPELASRGIAASLAVPTRALDAEFFPAGAPSGTLASIAERHMSRARWAELVAAGWDMLNHTRLHTSMSGLSQADAAAAIQAGTDDLRRVDPDGAFTRPDLFVWVGGVTSANAFAAAAQCGIKWAFKTSQEAFPNHEGHWCKHKYYRERYDMGAEKAGTSIETALLRVHQAVQMGGGLVAMWHKFTTASSGTGLPDSVTNSVGWLRDVLDCQAQHVANGEAVFLNLGKYYDSLDDFHRRGGHAVA